MLSLYLTDVTVWMVIAVGLFFVEIFTLRLRAMFYAIGALAASLFAISGTDPLMQAVMACLVASVGLWLFRPLMLKHSRTIRTVVTEPLTTEPDNF